jgi:hypothetical protein
MLMEKEVDDVLSFDALLVLLEIDAVSRDAWDEILAAGKCKE